MTRPNYLLLQFHGVQRHLRPPWAPVRHMVQQFTCTKISIPITNKKYVKVKQNENVKTSRLGTPAISTDRGRSNRTVDERQSGKPCQREKREKEAV